MAGYTRTTTRGFNCQRVSAYAAIMIDLQRDAACAFESNSSCIGIRLPILDLLVSQRIVDT